MWWCSRAETSTNVLKGLGRRVVEDGGSSGGVFVEGGIRSTNAGGVVPGGAVDGQAGRGAWGADGVPDVSDSGLYAPILFDVFGFVLPFVSCSVQGGALGFSVRVRRVHDRDSVLVGPVAAV
mmetsp:Transcript_60402/g.124197  ORF Transcript_60402/g.124197 Transcript_60402/m.124197 type:complete len:122 (+) Transcript_60402:3259-3624(+)